MNLLKYVQSHLNIKLFLSFVILIIVFTLVLIAAVEFVMPNAFANHLLFMNSLIEGNEEVLQQHEQNLYGSFRSAIYESLQFALPISLVSAIVISVFFSREFVRPIKELSKASSRISEGRYDQRVLLPKEMVLDEMDEVKQLAINFNQMASRLEKTEALRRQLIGDVSHELRTPIAFIKASMEGLIDGVVPTSEETFYRIQVEADRLSKLINDLQELSIIESGAYKLEIAEHDLISVIQNVTSNLSPQYSQKNVQIMFDAQEKEILAKFDIDRIKQVFTNILANAYQYSEKNSSVQISCIDKGQYVEVSVQDHGRGISSEDLPHIFTRFYRVDKSRSRKSGGTGIGLTIAKQLLEVHGGKIWAESEGKNKGTNIIFMIPRMH